MNTHALQVDNPMSDCCSGTESAEHLERHFTLFTTGRRCACCTHTASPDGPQESVATGYQPLLLSAVQASKPLPEPLDPDMVKASQQIISQHYLEPSSRKWGRCALLAALQGCCRARYCQPPHSISM